MKRIIAIALLAVSLVCCQCVNAKSKPIPQWPTPAGTLTKQEIIAKFFADNKQMDPIEGIWTTDDGIYEIAIIKNIFGDIPGHDFVGIITGTSNGWWQRGELKALFKKTADNQVYPCVWYAQDKTMNNVSFRSVSRTEIKCGAPQLISLIRVYPTVSSEADSAAGQSTVSIGTGFAVCPDLIVTSYHVVGQRPNIQLTSTDGTVSKGTVVVKDLANDLALIRVSGETTFATVALGKPCDAKCGGKVFTVGFPLPSELVSNAKIGEGIINSLTGLDGDPRMYQISIPVQPGNGGGPLLDDRGSVIGVVGATVNMNFAMKVNYLDNMLSLLPGQPQPTQGKGDTVMDAAQIFESVRKSVVLVTALDK